MKHLMCLFLFASSVTQTATEKSTIARLSGDNDAVARIACSDSLGCENLLTCQKADRGPRGKRGHRGHRGKRGSTGSTGASAAGNLRDQLFINAPMMTNAFAGTPDTFFSLTYSGTSPLEAWAFARPGTPPITSIGSQFVIPDALDRTQPVTLTIHCFNLLQEAFGSVRFQIQTDYKGNSEDLGTDSPSGGYAQTILTNDIPIIDPTNGGTTLKYSTIMITLDPSKMINKTWADIVITRVPTLTDTDYAGLIFLTELSVNYAKTPV